LFNAFDTSTKALTQIRDQLLSCAGEDFSGAKYFPIAHSNRDLNYSGLNPTATTLIPDLLHPFVCYIGDLLMCQRSRSGISA